MNKKILSLILIGFICFLGCENKTDNSGVTKYVDPFIGTGGHGHTFPGATLPFGMVQLSPDNPSKGWDWTSGYHYSDSVLLGFSHTHLSGTGVGDLYDILLMPFSGKYETAERNDKGRIFDIYNHKEENAVPGYYQVKLQNSKINAELTVTERTGFHRYSFEKKDAAVLIDLGYAQNFDRAAETFIKVVDNKTIEGYRISKGWAAYQPVYFVARFDKPFTAQLFDGNDKVTEKEVKSVLTSVVLNFESKNVMAKVALSSASVEGAKKNLQKEIPHWDFELVKNEANTKWENLLGKIKVTDKNEDAKKIFYTALYHSYLAPTLFTDENKKFCGADYKKTKAEGYTRYTLFSLWDTFRALHPLLTITKPELVDDLVKSMLAFYDETGLLPTWDLQSNDTNVMIGYHAVPVIIDAYFKGLTTADPERIFAACKVSAMQDNFGIDHFKKYGYIPSELEKEAVSKVLEYSFDDWCIAQLAKKLGKEEEYSYFSKRADAYKLMFDKATGFMRGKDKKGNWVKNFDPLFVEHRNTDYTEANAWQYTFHVLQDIKGLINEFGGEEKFVKKLDELFTISSEMTGHEMSPDISGLIGQYAHGNEPCHHVAYLYSFTSQPWKTQERISQIRKLMYSSKVDGLVGNDDCGQMSAWYIFSALGFYPVNPADGNYVIGTPLFEKTEITLENNKKLIVEAKNISDKNIYIKEILLNGKKLDRYYLTHKEIVDGGKLVFVMSDKH
ncbi:MAG: GH92 family glycosyl hydrolase [Rhodothermaceae bacterium]